MRFDGRAVRDERQLPEMVAEAPIGKSVPLEVIRDGRQITLHARIAEMPGKELVAATTERRGWNWGLSVQKLTPDIARELGVPSDNAVVITGVRPDSPADDAGLQRGDVVLELDHSRISSPDQFARLARQSQQGHKPALLLVERGNATLFTVINPNG